MFERCATESWLYFIKIKWTLEPLVRDASEAFSFRQIPENHSFSSPSQNDRSPHIEVSGRFCFYPMQLVTPSVVAIAVSMLMAI